MAGTPGRKIRIVWNGSRLLGCREKGITLNGEAINTTSDENDGWRTLLDVASENSIDISISGVTKDKVLKEAYFSGARTQECVIENEVTGESIAGTFFLANYSESAPYQDAVTFTATLQSASDDVVYEPGI